MSNGTKRLINFSAGPAKIPDEVLQVAQEQLFSYPGYGASILEMSHRSSTFMDIMRQAEADLRELLGIPGNYEVLFMHGGAVGAMASVAMNLSLGQHVDYLLTGTWSLKAAREAAKYAKVNLLNSPPDGKFNAVPDLTKVHLQPDAKYVFYCDNETVDGIEYPETPVIDDASVPPVVDMTSNFLSRPVDVAKYGCIFAASQKNSGIAGVTVVIVRKDLIEPLAITPTVFNYNIVSREKCLQNTPPVFAVYMCGLMLQWIKKKGGLAAMSERCKSRSALIYDVIDSSDGFYSTHVHKNSRSRINIPFRVGGTAGEDCLEEKFLKDSQAAGMIQLKGHHTTGGIRASMYNSMTLEEVQTLVQFMQQFMEENK